jgi:hypothetical protein
MKITVETEELKQEILKQSEYIHDFLINKDDVKGLGNDWLIGLDSDKAGILMHLYMAPQIIEVTTEQQRTMNKEELFEMYKGLDMKERIKFDREYIRFKEEEELKGISKAKEIIDLIVTDEQKPYFSSEWVEENILNLKRKQ